MDTWPTYWEMQQTSTAALEENFRTAACLYLSYHENHWTDLKLESGVVIHQSYKPFSFKGFGILSSLFFQNEIYTIIIQWQLSGQLIYLCVQPCIKRNSLWCFGQRQIPQKSRIIKAFQRALGKMKWYAWMMIFLSYIKMHYVKSKILCRWLDILCNNVHSRILFTPNIYRIPSPLQPPCPLPPPCDTRPGPPPDPPPTPPCQPPHPDSHPTRPSTTLPRPHPACLPAQTALPGCPPRWPQLCRER